jgi:FAD:protein FMN transferase
MELIRLETSVDSMGTTWSVVLYGDHRDRMEEAATTAFDEVHRLNNLLSAYRPASEWSEINRLAGQRPVAVSPEVFELIARCLHYSRRSQGTFDITVGPLIKTWGFFKGAGRLPGPDGIAAALAKTGYRHLHLDQADHTVRFDIEGMEINPGGIGKGYAVDRMVRILRQKGLDTALVMVSSSSIYGMGAPPDEPRGWRIDVRNPTRPRRHSATEVFLKDMSLSTSGGYAQIFRAEGRTFSHIMDPRTGYPAQGMLQVSVTAPRAIDSEAWTKPFFILGRAWAAKHKPKRLNVFFCEDGPEQAWGWLDPPWSSDAEPKKTPVVPLEYSAS